MTTSFLLEHDEQVRQISPFTASFADSWTADVGETDTVCPESGEVDPLRVQRILDADIRFIHSESFEAADAADAICGPFPQCAGKVAGGRPAPPAGTPPYLAALYSFPLLTPEQERHLFRKMNFLKYLAGRFRNQLEPKLSQISQIEQIERHLAEALLIRNKIVRANLRLVVSIAKPLVDAANEFDEIISDGNLPLIRAVELFDFQRGTRFSTYATWAVRNSLYRSTKRNRRRRQRFLSGDAVYDSLADHRPSERASQSYHHLLRQTAARMLEGLDSRDQVIVNARFGLGGHRRPQKYREIAEKLNLSTERVRQLMARALERMRESAGDDLFEPA